MRKQNKILIISKHQFGYLQDVYVYSSVLKKYAEVKIVCMLDNSTLIEVQDVDIRYVSHKNKYLRFAKFLLISCNEIFRNRGSLIFVNYFKFSSILKINFPFERIIIDIRTGSVKRSDWKRYWDDIIMKYESYFFSEISIISDCLAKRLRLKNYVVTPIYVDSECTYKKCFGSLKLLYIGTLNNRRITDTILAISKLKQKGLLYMIDQYHIVGSGSIDIEKELKSMIIENELGHIIQIHGYYPINQLSNFFESCNVGVCYIPITSYYNCQPPTKYYQYIAAGMAVLSTKTEFMIHELSESQGVLVNDDPESFEGGIVKLYNNRYNYDSTHISASANIHRIENLINHPVFSILR